MLKRDLMSIQGGIDYQCVIQKVYAPNHSIGVKC
jgi:hypothetical protein